MISLHAFDAGMATIARTDFRLMVGALPGSVLPIYAVLLVSIAGPCPAWWPGKFERFAGKVASQRV